MPSTTEQTKAQSQRRIAGAKAKLYGTGNAAPYPEHRGMLATKSNGLPQGWRRSLDGETIYRKAKGWVMVVRTSKDLRSEKGPFVLVGRQDAKRQWFDWQGLRTLEDAMAKGDEVIG